LARALAAEDVSLITSVGLNTWELLVHLASKNNLHQILVIPELDRASALSRAESLMSEFELSPHQVAFGFLLQADPTDNYSKDEIMHLRDEVVLNEAAKVIPVSIRPNGKLAALLAQERFRSKTIRDHQIPYRAAADKPHYEFDQLEPIGEAKLAIEHHIVHWTRSSHVPYDGESKAAYYEDVISSRTYPRSALRTLERIMQQAKIAASDRFIRGGFKVVALSGGELADCLALMRWRRRYSYYSFEPYGIAIEKQAAIHLGIRPVLYGNKNDYEQLAEVDRPYFQMAESESVDWKPESEWRQLGDLNLDTLPNRSVKIVVYRSGEIESIQKFSKWEVIALFN